MHARAVWWLALAACHVTTRTETTRPANIQRIRHGEGAVARRPALVLTGDGRLRFVEPLDCPTQEVVTTTRAIEIERGPNLATFVVGVIATAVGGILVVRGANDDDGAANPFTYGGVAALAGGLPLAIGPWVGQRRELREGAASAPVRRPGPSERCGERPLVATHATLTTRGIEVHGRVDRDGHFAISPFAIVDAFAVPAAPWTVSARVETASGARTIEAVIEPHALATHGAAFLASADIDATIEPVRVVPDLVPGTLRVSVTQIEDTAAARIVLAIENVGAGDAYALRGHVVAPGTPVLDGRIVYFGRVAKKSSVTRELLIPLAPAAANALRNANIDLALELRDAHGTAPTTPVRFRGTILVDAPR